MTLQEKAKYRGAIQKWGGAQAKLRSDIAAQADDATIQKDQAAVDQAEKEYRDLELAGADAGGGAPGAAPAAVAGVPDGAPTATDAQGNKVFYNGTTWVPAPKGGGQGAGPCK